MLLLGLLRRFVARDCVAGVSSLRVACVCMLRPLSGLVLSLHAAPEGVLLLHVSAALCAGWRRGRQRELSSLSPLVATYLL